MGMGKITFVKSGMLALALLLSAAVNLIAQESARPPVEKIHDRWEDKIVLEFTNDMWVNLPSGVELRPFSPGFKGYLFSDYSFGKSDFSFAWGLGVSVDNVHSNATFLRGIDVDGVTLDQELTPFPEGYEYNRNKLVTTFIEIPIEFRYIHTGPRPFKMAVGFRVGYMVSNHQKIIDTEGKRKYYDFDALNEFRYGLSARMGVGFVQLTGFYSLVPLVDPGKGSDVIAVSLGLAFTFIK